MQPTKPTIFSAHTAPPHASVQDGTLGGGSDRRGGRRRSGWMDPEAASVQDDQFPGLPRSPVLELRNRRLRRAEVWHLRTSLRCSSCGRKPVRVQRWRFGRRRERWPTSTVCTRVQRQRYKRPSEASPVQLTRAGRVLEQALFVYLSTRELVARVRVEAKLLQENGVRSIAPCREMLW